MSRSVRAFMKECWLAAPGGFICLIGLAVLDVVTAVVR